MPPPPRAKIQHAIDIENDQKLAVEPRTRLRRRRASLRSRLTGFGSSSPSGELEHFADRIDQKAERFAPQFDADRHRRAAVFARRQVRAGCASRSP